MGAYLKYGSLAVGVYGSHQPGTVQPMSEQRWDNRFNYEKRENESVDDRFRWRSSWFGGCSLNGSGVAGLDGAGVIGQDIVRLFPHRPMRLGRGSPNLKFIKGRCEDTSGNALSGVVVQGFRTSDDAFCGYEVQSREDGSYDLPTNYPGVNHYAVAYLAGSPDRAGTTVNTLVPANIDGT